jgi:hypothetical protein
MSERASRVLVILIAAALLAPAAPVAADGPGARLAQYTRDAELLFWDTVRNSHNPADFRAYLARFPNGLFVDLARNRIAELQPGANPPPVTALAPPPRQGNPDQVLVQPPSFPPPPAPPSHPGGASYAGVAAAAAAISPRAYDPLYAEMKAFKALAIHVESGRGFALDGLATQQLATQLTLEGCQQTYASACVLVAEGADVKAADSRHASRVDMPRVRYRGRYNPDEVPFLPPGHEIESYPTLPGAKAMAARAFHPRVAVASGARDAAEAERRALAECNADNSPYPCFLYASGDQVVLTERHTEPRP